MKNRFRVPLSFLCIVTCLSLYTQTVCAQETEDATAALFSSVSLTFSSVATTGSLILTTRAIKAEQTAQLNRYVKDNEQGLLGDVVLGGGHHIKDLATLLQVDHQHLRAFGRFIRIHNKTISDSIKAHDAPKLLSQLSMFYIVL